MRKLNHRHPLGAANTYEELPVFKASEILRPEMLAGPHHKVREEVPTYFGANKFTIDSDFGVFEANGNEMLIRRINEINAIAKLKEVSRSDEFKNAFSAMTKQRIDAVALPEDDFLNANRSGIAELAAKQRLPSIGRAELRRAADLPSAGSGGEEQHRSDQSAMPHRSRG